MHQVLDRLVNYMPEQVKCIDSLVQGKIPTNPREVDSTPPTVNHTQVVMGPKSVMG